MAENVNANTESTAATTAQEDKKVFTKEEMSAIVQDRLDKERARFADYDTLKEKAAKYDEAEEANKTELQKAQEKATALEAALDKIKKDQAHAQLVNKVASEKNVPATLLTGNTEDELNASADALLKFKGDTGSNSSGGYPSVRDGGEKKFEGTKKTNRDAFAELFNKI